MKKIIINADDLGMNSSVNEAIKDLIERGLLKSTSIMVKRNQKAFDDALDIVSKLSGSTGFGVHMDLDDFFPFDESGHYGIYEDDIPSNFHEILLKNAKRIEKDMRYQISTLIDSGVVLTHLDGHHNIHLFPEIFEILLPLLREYGINKVRFPGSFYKSDKRKNTMLTILKQNKINCPDDFIDMGQLIKNPSILRELSSSTGITEIMTHVSTDKTIDWVYEQYSYFLENPSLWNDIEFTDYSHL